MTISKRYEFEPVFRSGDIEVLRVHRKDSSSQVMHDDTTSVVRKQFLAGIRFLDGGSYEAARTTFEHLREVDGFEGPATFYAAVAAEFSLQLEDAGRLFRELSQIPQAGRLLLSATEHKEVIAWLDSAAQAPSTLERASLYFSSSLAYWLMGFRTPARQMLARTREADSTYFLGPIFGALYAMQEDDLLTAEAYARQAERLRAGDERVIAVTHILALADSLQRENSRERRAIFHRSIGDQYRSMGLNDFAVEEFLAVLRDDPENATALRSLAAIYVDKRRFAAAARMLRRLLVVNPRDREMYELLQNIEKR
jgi:tetratricopeptide (TPR) repeat protein